LNGKVKFNKAGENSSSKQRFKKRKQEIPSARQQFVVRVTFSLTASPRILAA
jgi:hypothetical protein